MAILVEEEKKPVNWITILTLAVVIVGLFGGGYYLFFKQPEKIEVVLPGTFKEISTISSSTKNFDPTSVLDPASQEREAKVFALLQNFASALVLPATGKNNPFKP